MVFNASFGPSRFSLDYLIEKHWPKWALLAEIKNKSGFDTCLKCYYLRRKKK